MEDEQIQQQWQQFIQQRRRRICGEVQRQVVVLVQGRPEDVEEVQGQGQGLQVLEKAQVRQADEAGQGVEMVVVDEEGPQGVEAVQGEGEGLVVLEGQRLRLWKVGFL